ncbi:MAG: outer membrane lipoprotein-sorting protein [Spirochaetales bacterium]|nr:outer membrane lipoprotein-sorting protein [Spirochaetales bacterium]
MKQIKTTIIGVILFFIQPVLFYGEEDALAIIRKMEEMHNADSSKTELTMLIYPDVHDKETYRSMKVLSYSKGDEDSYMVFLTPKTIKGLSILSKGGDQWVYFPSTGRVRKIAAKSKGESVKGVGGDFSYEDMGGGKFEEKYGLAVTASYNDKWVIRGIPKDKDSVYSMVVIHVGKKDYLIQKVEYYTEEDGHYKDLIMKEVKKVGDRLMPTQMIMANLVKESMTVIITNAAEYDVPIDDKYFNPNRFYK